MLIKENRSSVYDYHGYFQQCLILQLTLRCPLRCEHCIVDASPNREEEMTVEQAVNLLEEIGRENEVKVVAITGGEPFLNLERLGAILTVAQKYNLKIAIVTSASWATDYNKAIKILKQLPPIANLSLSADKYHLDFVSLKRVKNAAQAAISLGIEVGAFICLESDEDDFLQIFQQNMGEELYTKMKIITEYVHIIGRAINSVEINSKIERVALEDLPTVGCPTASAPAIMTDGTVMACCGDTVSDTQNWEALKLGNLNHESISEILSKAEDNLLVHALRLMGPKKLALIAAEKFGNHIFKQLYEKNNICDICRTVSTNPQVVAYLREYLQQPEIIETLALGRLLKFGEQVKK